jgi:hypothetical protein
LSLLVDYTGGQFIRRGKQLTKVNILRLALGYLNMSINRPTQNQNQSLEPAGLGKSGKCYRRTGVGEGLADDEVGGRVFK